MDISAVLMPGAAAPTDATLPAAATPGDAFATVFASALGEAVEVPTVPAAEGVSLELAAVAAPTTATVTARPSETPASGLAAPAVPEIPAVAVAPAFAPTPAAALPPSVETAQEAAPSEPEILPQERTPVEGTPSPDDGPTETRLSEAAQAPKEAPTRPVRGRGRTRVESPPEPPPDASLNAAPEKEAPTTAPNAPVTPLDRSSESLRPVEGGKPAAAAPPTTFAGNAPLTNAPLTNAPFASAPLEATTAPMPVALRVASTGSPSRPAPVEQASSAARPAPKPILADEKPEDALPEGVGGIPEEGEFTPFVVSAATVPAAPAAPIVSQSPDPAALGARPEIVATSSLAAAPDLGVVPQAMVPPSAGLPPEPRIETAPSTVPNPRVDAFAAGRASVPTAVEADKPSPKGLDKTGDTDAPTFELETALIEREATKGGGDAPTDDAPKEQPAPQVGSEPAVRSAATERPEIGGDRPSVDRHLVVRQVADRIESMLAARPKDGVTVHLEPRDLGTVTLVVKGLASALDVQVTASDDRVRQSIDASRPELAQSLAPRGIELRELRVATAPSGGGGTSASASGSNAQSGGQANPEGRSRPQTPSQPFAKPSRAEGAASRGSVRRLGGRGVDLLV